MGGGNSTAFAAAHVSGALAVLKSRLPNMPMAVLRAVLLTTATDMGDPGVDADYGWGMVNLAKAITVQGGVALARLSDSTPPSPEPDALPADGVFVLPARTSRMEMTIATVFLKEITVSATSMPMPPISAAIAVRESRLPLLTPAC